MLGVRDTCCACVVCVKCAQVCTGWEPAWCRVQHVTEGVRECRCSPGVGGSVGAAAPRCQGSLSAFSECHHLGAEALGFDTRWAGRRADGPGQTRWPGLRVRLHGWGQRRLITPISLLLSALRFSSRVKDVLLEPRGGSPLPDQACVGGSAPVHAWEDWVETWRPRRRNSRMLEQRLGAWGWGGDDPQDSGRPRETEKSSTQTA